jgi:hypothetical protein
VGLSEAKARETHDVVTAVVRFDSTTRTIIDGRTGGFCKLIVDRTTCRILGCHVVGERAVEIVQVAAIAIAARMRVNDLAHIPLSFPTYAGILAHVAGQRDRRTQSQSELASTSSSPCRRIRKTVGRHVRWIVSYADGRLHPAMARHKDTVIGD